MAKLTQCDRILRHLEDYGSIDPMIAIKEYGCMRLASRISDLKGRGIEIIAERTKGSRRGFHAHRKLQQVLIAIHGSCKILLDDGSQKQIVELTKPNEGLLVGNAMWREMYDFSDGAVLMVLASEFYDEADYIRNYEDFLEYVKENG